MPGGCDEEVAKCGIDTEKETIECQGGCRQEAARVCKESGPEEAVKEVIANNGPETVFKRSCLSQSCMLGSVMSAVARASHVFVC